MRTLKKTLALVLCLAMIAGLCCFGTSAAFADAAEIEKTEAVEVMNALGVLKGDGTNFNPKGILTRAEAAVMIAKLLGDGDLKATSSYKDMAGYEWAQSYAAVCEQKGIIKGDGAGNFLPGQTLTGYQFGLMLCRALGYNPSAEGVESATYEIGTAALMKKIGLNKAIVGFDGTAGLTRENAAALMLKALQTTMVYYPVAGTTITGNGFTITTGNSVATKEEWDDTTGYNYTGTVSADGETVEFVEVYFPKLKLDATTGDYYKRPANIWTLDGKPVGTYAATPVLTYTAPVTGGQLYTDLGKPVAGFDFVAYNNGYLFGAATEADIVSGDTSPFGGNGTLIEIYKNVVTGDYTAVAEQTFVGTITGWTPATKDANGDIITGSEEYVTVSAAGQTGLTFKTTDFSLADVTAATTVLVKGTYDGTDYTVRSVKAATSKTVTATWANAISFIADGVTYKYAENVDGAIAGSDVTGKVAKTVYFDDYGYVIKVANPAAATPNYAYVMDTRTIASGWNTGDTYEAKLLYADATIETVAIPAADVALEGKLVTYAPGVGANTGKIDLTDASAGYAASYTFTKNVPSQNGDLFNDKTVFVYETTAQDGVTKVYTAYTGITNAPSASGSVAMVQDGTVKVCFLMAATVVETTTTSTDVAYIYGASKKAATDVTKGAYEVYTAVVNGTITTVETVAGLNLDGFYDVLTKNSLGLVSVASDIDTPDVATIVDLAGGAVNVAAKDGLLMFNSNNYIYDANTTVYLANAVTGAITASNIGAITTSHVVVDAYTTNGILTTVIYAVAPV